MKGVSHPNNVARKLVFWLVTWGMVVVWEGNRSPNHVMNIRVTCISVVREGRRLCHGTRNVRLPQSKRGSSQQKQKHSSSNSSSAHELSCSRDMMPTWIQHHKSAHFLKTDGDAQSKVRLQVWSPYNANGKHESYETASPLLLGENDERNLLG